MQQLIKIGIWMLPLWLLAACVLPRKPVTQADKVELGRELFFDKMLSEPDGQACSVCHSPRAAFADPFNAPISEGMIDGAFVNRNGQSLMYVSFIPPLSKNAETGEYRGGLFWDGRSNDLRHQLSGPLFNPAEMNNSDTSALVYEIKFAEWRKAFNRCYNKPKTELAQYNAMVDALAHFEESELFRPFTSAYDAFLKGDYRMTPEERIGYDLFRGQANCAKCHSMDPIDADGHVLFSNYSYHNVGLPRFEDNPFYTTLPTINPNGRSAIDLGLGAVINDPQQNGKFRTPSLRNAAVTGPYFHHGGVATLEEAVHFMVARDAMGLQPEFNENIEHKWIGGMQLTAPQEKALVAFLQLLTDGFTEVP